MDNDNYLFVLTIDRGEKKPSKSNFFDTARASLASSAHIGPVALFTIYFNSFGGGPALVGGRLSRPLNQAGAVMSEAARGGMCLILDLG